MLTQAESNEGVAEYEIADASFLCFLLLPRGSPLAYIPDLKNTRRHACFHFGACSYSAGDFLDGRYDVFLSGHVTLAWGREGVADTEGSDGEAMMVDHCGHGWIEFVGFDVVWCGCWCMGCMLSGQYSGLIQSTPPLPWQPPPFSQAGSPPWGGGAVMK